MGWQPPPAPEWVDRLNAHGDAVGGPEHLIALDADELLVDARSSTGFDDLGEDTWRPHYEVLLRALNDEARLTTVGRLVARTELLRALRQRLLLTDAWAIDSTILDEAIDTPVFVVGTGRSGTSLLHELLALDPANRTPKTWELLHPGEVLSSEGTGDSATPARRAGHDVHAFWADLQPAYDTMHHNHGDETNECIFATMLEFLSDQWGGTYDVPSYSAHLVGADHTEAYRYHRRVLQTLQRAQAGERWVLKAPSHLAQLRVLFAVYPDARVVQLHRDPLKTVPSTVSLMGTIRSMRCRDVEVDTLAPLISLGYALMLDDTMDARAAGELPDDRFVDVRYADLLADPTGTVAIIYDSLGAAVPAGLPAAVTHHLAERPQAVRGAHRYSLADTGLDATAERARFRRYQQHYDVPDEA